MKRFVEGGDRSPTTLYPERWHSVRGIRVKPIPRFELSMRTFRLQEVPAAWGELQALLIHGAQRAGYVRVRAARVHALKAHQSARCGMF
jgi:hypothetical protein